MARILVIRFSALGDVAMTVPVIYSLATQYPQHEIFVLSRAMWHDLFGLLPANVHFVGADLTGKHKTPVGLHKLYHEVLKPLHISHVADFHGVLRSRCLSLRFRLGGVPVAVIDKGRKGKKALVREKNKVRVPQKSSFDRYADVLERLGFPVTLRFDSLYGGGKGPFAEIEPVTGPRGTKKWIGIAPFARHAGKTYPPELMEQVVAHLASRHDAELFLFGGGADERRVCEEWQRKYPSVHSMVGKLNLHMELNLMSHLDVMLSMDSGNMHLASLAGTPVVSVWGATHSYAGFMGWGQSDRNAVQLDLPCRPCSVFGQKPCRRGDYACLRGITPQQIIAKVETAINSSQETHEE